MTQTQGNTLPKQEHQFQLSMKRYSNVLFQRLFGSLLETLQAFVSLWDFQNFPV